MARIVAGQGALGAVADAVRFRFTEADIPVVPPLSDHEIRLVIGPANEAGQGKEWAHAVERNVPTASATVVRAIGADPFQPAVDLNVPVAVYRRSEVWHEAFEAYLSSHTHVIWESGLRLLGRRYDDVVQEIRRLEGDGVRGALLFHGSDIRPPSRHAEQSAWSPFHRTSEGPVRAFEDRARRNLALAEQAGVPVFVSTPDLLQWVPSAHWCPVVVDSQRWREAKVRNPSTKRPVVVHAPSSPWLKGTALIEPVVRTLDQEGVIEYREVQGVPHAAMPAFYGEADVMLDQFALGSYGVAAGEAMAAGTVVMGHVDEHTRRMVRERTGMELPVWEATAESLEEQLRLFAAEPEAFAELRTQGQEYVRRVHDGQMSARALAPFLGVTWSTP